METIRIRQTLRPLRYAFIVREGNLSDATQAVSLNSALWGGVYNPIIPFTPTKDRDSLISAFDPDALVNLTGSSLPEEYVEAQGFEVMEAADIVSVDHLSKPRWNLGFPILPVLRNIYEKEVRFSSGSSRATLIDPASAPGWPEYAAFVYGAFSWLPTSDIDFERHFKRLLRSKTLPLGELSLPPDLDLATPLTLTRHGLIRRGGSAAFSSHIVFLGDHTNVEDLVAFWNIRATGRTVAFVPFAAYRTFERLVRAIGEEGRYPVNQSVSNQADFQKAPSITEAAFVEAFEWIKTLTLGIVARSWQPRYNLKEEYYVGDIHVEDLLAHEGEEISFLDKGQMSPVKLVDPPFLTQRYTSRRHTWAIELSMSGASWDLDYTFSFPKERSLSELIVRGFIGLSVRPRIGRRSIVIQEDSLGGSLYIQPIRTREVFKALFSQAGIDATPSNAGQYAEQIIRKMGSLQFDCRVLKFRGVREVIHQLGSKSSLPKGEILHTIMLQKPDDFGRNWRPELYEDLVLEANQRGPANASTIFKQLLDRHILRPGLSLKCSECSKRTWYHVSSFGEEFKCRYCFSMQRVDFASKLEWKYRTDGLFRIPDSAQGSVAVILSLWRLEMMGALQDARYITSHKCVVKDTGQEHEIDFAYYVMDGLETTYDLVLGEARQYREFIDDDTQKLATLAAMFPQKPYLCFSTLKDGFSSAEKDRLRRLRDDGHRVIALTREELDCFDLHGRFANAPNKAFHDLKALSENSLFMNVGK